MLVMAGESGCGKTHVARAIYRYCRAAALRAYTDGAGKTWRGGSLPSATFARWPEVAAEIAAGHTGLIEELREADLAVLDDIGAENDPWKKAADALCQLLSRREFRFSVVTTNIKLEEWSSRFDTRTADRLLRNSEVINLFGVKSYAMI
jgi:DNA replication protein DnaC